MSQPTEVTVFAPASIGNVAVGYDVLGCAVEGIGDRVTVRRLDAPTIRIDAISGVAPDLPTAPAENTATAALQDLQEGRSLSVGFEVSIEKGIPLSAGMGGSAASAVGAVVAAAQVLPHDLTPADLLPHALAGEAVSSGSAHPDNVVPCLYGGLALTHTVDPPEVVSLPVPTGLQCVLVRPDYTVETREARAALPTTVPLATATQQMAHLGTFVAGCYRDDCALIGRALRDTLAEPHRTALVPGAEAVQRAAREAGALGCSFSGAGPTLFAWCDAPATAAAVREAMTTAFAEHNLDTESWITGVAAEEASVVSPSA